jgi:hypothetical protein
VNEDELTDVRRALAARVESCFDRLDDVVAELVELHGVPVETIVARVYRAADDRRDLEAAEASGSV